ncbi:hypothetical protein ACOQFV_24370 [Nocardiopsis changdeensis]|uniref:DUF2637 domain-containing protein n=1 Tax=Nocardiopsis changdeensis TaxID=2831969 RepID=A0A975KTF7_9ACTN|nr:MULTISPECIES: hypothetical protein [Nocardiopsis]QUX26473.1 hypothetical protein KGD84_32765 [Nocardiopsis changdeensis]QYX40745.1 hypothetical protein K1J57_32615 [Nocardiopsis sp. MT53]
MTMLRREDSAAAAQAQDAEPLTESRRHRFVSWNPFAQRANTPRKPRDWGYGAAITAAFTGIAMVSAMTMYVSYEAQHRYTESIKGDSEDQSIANHLAAASWDVAAAVFALLALATAMRGDSPLRARIGNILCAAASVLMNGARFAPPADASALDWVGHLIVWVGPALLYAGTTDTIVLEIQQRAMQRRGLHVEHPSIWSVLGIIVRGCFGVVLWVGRVVFSPFRTLTLFRSWYLAEVAYAPGRTLEGDKAREALAAAAEAQGVTEEIKRRSAAAVAAAQADYTARANAAEEAAREQVETIRAQERARADEAIRSERQRATTAIDAERGRANAAIADADARVQEMQEAHLQEVQRLQGDYAAVTQEMQDRHAGEVAELREQLERVGADAGAATTELRAAHRAELQRVREQAAAELERRDTHHQQQMAAMQRELDDMARRAASLGEANRALGVELEYMREAAPSKMRLRWLYDDLGRRGDPRYRQRAAVREVAHELLDAAGMSSIGTAVSYLTVYLDELEDQHGPGADHAPVGLS